ncbi:MAG: hypothetical protein HOO95_01500 [Gallionella sp.]|nr:hypothetical protein [Gallionella sp.]
MISNTPPVSSTRAFIYATICCLLLVMSGCASNQMESNFFDKEYDQAGTRFAEYAIPDQIKIYLYGMQAITPPAPVLSRPIAELGQAAILPILGELSRNPTEANIRDLMVVFETMQRLGTYDVANDKMLMKTLDNYVNGMKNNIWRGYTKEKLTQLKKSRSDMEEQN